MIYHLQFAASPGPREIISGILWNSNQSFDATVKTDLVTGFENDEALLWTTGQLEQLTTKILACPVVSPVACYLCVLCTLTQREIALPQFTADLCYGPLFTQKRS